MMDGFPTMGAEALMITGRGHCSNCNAFAPYRIKYGPFLTGAYCWRHLPAGGLDLVKKLTAEVRANHDAMIRVFDAGNRNPNPDKPANEAGLNHHDLRTDARDLFFQFEDTFNEAGWTWRDIADEIGKGRSHESITRDAEQEAEEDEEDEEREDDENE